MDVAPRSLLVARMDETDIEPLEAFDCGDDEMNRFLKEECFEEQSLGLNSTYVLYYKGELAAFCSICADKISLSSDEQEQASLPRKSAPAIKIARLGRSVSFRGHEFGRFMVEYVHFQVLTLRQAVGVRYLTLDAYPSRVAYYESLGFAQNLAHRNPKSHTVSMRKDIFHVD